MARGGGLGVVVGLTGAEGMGAGVGGGLLTGGGWFRLAVLGFVVLGEGAPPGVPVRVGVWVGAWAGVAG